MRKIPLFAAALATAAVLPSLSHAAPVVADAAKIGSLSGSATEWTALWPSNASNVWSQYLVAYGPDGNTYVNTGSANGNIIFRGNNSGNVTDPTGNPSRAWLDSFSNFNTGGLRITRNTNSVAGDGAIINVTGTAAAAGISVTSNWVAVNATSTAAFNGIGLNGYASGTSSVGVQGHASYGTAGVAGYGSGINTDGVRGIASAGIGVYASSNGGASHPGSSYGIYSDGAIAGNSFISVSSFVSGSYFSATSDKRVKRDIADSTAGLDDIDKLHVVRFKYNGLGETLDNGQEQLGVIAQELEQTHPSLVSTIPRKLNKGDKTDTDVKTVNHTAFTFMLINAVKELKGQVSDLQKIVCDDHPDRPSCAKKHGRP